MNMQIKVQKGFTLVEIAIVLIIVTVLLGYTVALFPIQQELKEYRQAEAEMDDIVDALVAFAQVNGRLPCPDTSGDLHNADPNTSGPGVIDGVEDFEDLYDNSDSALGPDNLPDNCKSYFGFLPVLTLGMNGDINTDGVLQDPWGVGYGYAISNINADADLVANTAAGIDLISPNGIREEGITALTTAGPPDTRPDLFVCTDSNSTGDDNNCGDVSGDLVVGNVAAVVISLGKSNDLGAASSNIQRENFDSFHDGLTDKVYISSTRSDANNAEYDDLVKWLSPNLLFSKMIEADQLP